MKIFELLQEDIDFASSYQTIVRAMYEQILIETINMIKTKKEVESFKNWLQSKFSKILQDEGQNVWFKFYKFKTEYTDGKFVSQNKNNFVLINETYLNTFINDITHIDIRYHRGELKPNDLKYMLHGYVLNFCKAVFSVVMHEITHHEQHVRSDANPNSYYSYLAKNTKKFYEILNGTIEQFPNKRKTYLASPQEIDSFSKTFVARWFANIIDVAGEATPPEVILELLKQIIIQIPLLIKSEKLGVEYKKTFGVDSKIYKRFVKKIYQELSNLYEEYYAKLEKETLDDKINYRMPSEPRLFWKAMYDMEKKYNLR